MPVTTRESSELNFKLYTGIANMNVVSVNPNKLQLEALGMKPDKEPDYTLKDKDTGVKKGHRFTFFLKGSIFENDVYANHSVFMEPVEVTSVFIDRFGRFNSDISKLDKATARHPFRGEIDMILFLHTLANSAKGDDMYLDTIEQMVKKGASKELKDTVKDCTGNMVKVLLGVRNEKYQTVYDRRFERPYNNDISYFWKSLTDNQAYISNYFGDIDLETFDPEDFKLKEYVPSADSILENNTAKSNGIEEAQVITADNDDDDDDLPF